MGEANRWQDAFSQALREQAILIAGLIKQVRHLENKLNEITQDPASRKDVIHGITGAKYVPLVFERPSGFSEATNPVSDEQQTEPTPLHE